MFRVWGWVSLGTVACGVENAPHDGACSSGEWWTGGNEESALMRPGGDCVGCHASGEGPDFTVAGTVMGDLADADDCFGVEGVTVHVTDADGVTHDVVTNAAGNFFLREDVPTPYSVELELEGRTTAMVTQQSEGSCASCHTEVGENAAPGRAVAP
jgi:hypothetical protein